jgi:hypothetical protein
MQLTQNDLPLLGIELLSNLLLLLRQVKIILDGNGQLNELAGQTVQIKEK